MYINILKIILNRRIDLKLNFFEKCLKKLKFDIKNKKRILYLYIIIKYIFSILMGIGLYFIVNEKYIKASASIIIILSIVSKIIAGAIEYKNTFMFPFEELIPISLAKGKKIYITQLLVSLLYNLLFDDFLVMSIVYIAMSFGLSFVSSILLLNFILVNIISFFFGNLLIGKYTYSIIINKVGILRMLLYVAFTTLIYAVSAFTISKSTIFIQKRFIKNIHSLDMLLDDEYLEKLFNSVGDIFLTNIQTNLSKTSVIAQYFTNPILLLTTVVTIFILLTCDIKLIPTNRKLEKFNAKDFYYNYYRYLKIITGKINEKCFFLKYQIESFLEYRWLLVKNFFQIAFMDYESVAYIGVLSTLAFEVNDNILKFQIILCMNIMVIINQSAGLRNSAYSFFALSPEIEKLKLIKMSIANKDILWKEKERIFYGFMIIPTFITLMLDAFIMIALHLPSYYFLMVLLIVVGYFWISPKIQLHMIPMLTNIDYLGKSQIGESLEEDEIAGKMQEFPRFFLVVAPMMLTIAMLIIKQLRVNIIVYFELVYLMMSVSIFYIYLKKIRNRGVYNLFKKIK